MSRISVLLLFYVIFYSSFYMTTSLPVTSKPIENTPEHLAWEAWIMVPSHYDKAKKITPKSIFIVPNGTNGGNGLSGNNAGNGKGSAFMPQIQCPPGHTIDNFKCIPTVSIDQSQILITRLTNLVHSTDKYNGTNTDINDSYDYDYEYDTYETDETQHFQNTGIRHGNENPSSLSLSSSSISSSSDYSGEPLKINLSLGKFPPVDKNEENSNKDKTEIIDNLSSSEDGDTSIEIENKGIKVQPFRDKETETTTTKTTKTTQTSTLSTSNSGDKTNSSTTISNRDTTTHATTTVIPDKLDSSISDKISPVRSRTVTANVTTNAFPILSPSEMEMLTNNQTNLTATTKDIQDYDLDDQSTSRTTTINDEMELITTFDEPKSTDFKEDVEKDSLIIQDGNSKTTTIEVETTETEEPVFSTTPLDQNDDGNTDAVLVDESNSSDISKATTLNLSPSNTPTIAEQENPTNTDDQISNSHIDENQNANSQSKETSDSQRDAAPLMETVESNNRFVYHHLGSTNSVSNSPQQKIETTTTSPDIRDQLRIINQIVEENKRRAQQQHLMSSSSLPNSKIIRFPQDNENHHNSNHHQNRYDNVRSDFVRFPTDSISSSSHFTSTQVHHKSPQDSFYPSSDKKFYQPSSLHPPLIPPPAISSPINIRNTNGDYRQNSKPFWWLPTGWEVDRTGNRPMMVRFWSRIPAEPYTTNSNSNNRISTIPAASLSTSSTTTTSRYRENSRSPTENLYRQEIFAQQKDHLQQHQQHQYQQDDVYSVLGAKQWKHNNR